MQKIKAVVFDAYGTLFDVNSVAALCNELFPGKGETLSQIWRSKQLEYTWLRSLMGRYVNFSVVTEEALVFGCKSLNLDLAAPDKDRLMEEYRRLKHYPEVPETLKEIKKQKKAIFSNGSLDILQPLTQYSGLDKYLDHVLTADEAKIYKPHPNSYTIILEKLGVKREEVLFVSSNSWDAAGAKSFGFHVAWVNRNNKPMDELNQTPDLIIENLRGILGLLQD